jgi:TRAP-type uncharacterized transport system substrate-binding protein
MIPASGTVVTPDRRPLRLSYIIRLLLAVAVAGVIGYGVMRAVPPRSVTIGTGPVGGSYYEIALRYREFLARHGIDLVLRPNPDSLGIISDVDRAGSGVDIGFTAQALDHNHFRHTRAAGAVQLQPLFMFAQTRMGKLASLARMRNLRIVMPPQSSATSEAAIAVLRLYGVTDANTQMQFLPLAEAVASLRRGDADVGVFMLDPSNPLVSDMLGDPQLRLVNFGEGSAVTRHLPFLRITMLPHSSFAIDAAIPPEDVALLAATVNVVVRQDLHPAVLFTLLEAMKETHHGATMISDVGEFPSVASTDLIPHPLALEYSKTGMPWIYRNLPLSVASLIDSYLIIGVALLILAEIYKNLKYLAEMTNVVLENVCLRALGSIERSALRGKPISRTRLLVVRLAEQALVSTSKRKRGEDLIGRIRDHSGAEADRRG